jgi:hypothetical protein
MASCAGLGSTSPIRMYPCACHLLTYIVRYYYRFPRTLATNVVGRQNSTFQRQIHTFTRRSFFACDLIRLMRGSWAPPRWVGDRFHLLTCVPVSPGLASHRHFVARGGSMARAMKEQQRGTKTLYCEKLGASPRKDGSNVRKYVGLIYTSLASCKVSKS